MKERYKKYSTYLLDSFGYNALKYRFYAGNYDIQNKEWRQGEDWMVTKVTKGIEEKLEKREYKAVTT